MANLLPFAMVNHKTPDSGIPKLSRSLRTLVLAQFTKADIMIEEAGRR
jgi:hypothetical protein